MPRILSFLCLPLVLLALAASLTLSADPHTHNPAGLALLLFSGLVASLGCLLCSGCGRGNEPGPGASA
ncbi:hypothetical protein [Pseudomonas mangiferae]|uniref:Uncharacterized protein n=1 Tax=Pseudomonas mangiferae TaxID=2593654 RepID=A0A553H4W7_9PSED|nr:hypothetical protein [Pseudomonas mangiferae]TRX76820.1 hypothetical protein FM069_02030 [Pseudomonas mangiferae]